MGRISDDTLNLWLREADKLHLPGNYYSDALEELRRWREVERRLRESAKRNNAFAKNCLKVVKGA